MSSVQEFLIPVATREISAEASQANTETDNAIKINPRHNFSSLSVKSQRNARIELSHVVPNKHRRRVNEGVEFSIPIMHYLFNYNTTFIKHKTSLTFINNFSHILPNNIHTHQTKLQSKMKNPI